uniref:ADAMTS cysteine-rich domain-containing protein n=1 Tax=Parascaris equorum TaxID=6256 RepID=A0A914RDP5_PAREQ
MEKSCPFWRDERECVSKECGIGYCDDEVPSALKRPASISVFDTQRLESPGTFVMCEQIEEEVYRNC